MNIPIQSLWVGSNLSKVEQLSIASYLYHGHEYHLYTYNEIENVPKGAKIFDANPIIPESDIFKVQLGWGKGSYASFADLFRFKLLLEKGGWWFDTDIICLKPITLEDNLIIATSFEDVWGVCANNCVLKAEAGNKLMERLYFDAKSKDISNIEFGHTGVHLLQGLAKEMKMEKYFVPFEYFNPISWRDVGYYILGQQGSYKNQLKEIVRPLLKPDSMIGKKIPENAFCVHFWNEVWRQNHWDKNARYAKSSLFERLKTKHGIS